jgi:hypothetical protein
MRLDARKGDTGWPCYDAKRCCMVEGVLWVDDATARWCQLVRVPGPPFIAEVDHQEDRITIYPTRRIVIFNEIEGVGDEQDDVAGVIERPEGVTA